MYVFVYHNMVNKDEYLLCINLTATFSQGCCRLTIQSVCLFILFCTVSLPPR